MAAELDANARRHLLTHGEIEVEGRILASSNQALLVVLRDEDLVARACYKAEAGERPLWDFDEGLWRREVAAYELDRLLGLDLVPETVARDDAPFGPGSLQWWIDDPTDEHYFTLREQPEHLDWMRRLAVFDVVANNADRKSGHVIYDLSRCWAIDHGLCFHVENKLRTVIWDFADEPIEPTLLNRLSHFAHEESSVLDELLAPDEVLATRQRAGELFARGVLPIPDLESDWPPYPWPLI